MPITFSTELALWTNYRITGNTTAIQLAVNNSCG